MKSEELYDYALSFFGIPYQWGGDGPGRSGGFGYDCSGFVQAVLKKVNLDPPGDQTAHALYLYFKEKGTKATGFGALAFFGRPEAISHVGWMIDDKIMISAAGGGSSCLSPHVAKQLGASIKIQPINYYRNFVAAYVPNYLFS